MIVLLRTNPDGDTTHTHVGKETDKRAGEVGAGVNVGGKKAERQAKTKSTCM